MIGIICAMPEEVAGFLDTQKRGARRAGDFTEVVLGSHEAVIAGCGLGKVNAAMTAATMIERYGCRALVSAGTAGGLDGAAPMQVVVGTALIQHDYGRSRDHGELELYRPGVPPLPEYHSDDYALSLPEARLRRFESATRGIDFVRYGRFASGDTFVNDAATGARLVGLGALAVDMECAAVAQVAEFHHLPWLVAKGISDSVSGQSHDQFLGGLAEASRRSGAVVRRLLSALSD